MSKEEIKDMILKQCLELTTNNDFRPPISAYDGVDIDDVVRTCKQLQDKKTYLDLVKENQELKKQLEEYENEPLTNKISRIDCVVSNIYSRNKNQQKEFIKYLEDKININPYDISDYDYEDIINTILSKYKEIIGDDK